MPNNSRPEQTLPMGLTGKWLEQKVPLPGVNIPSAEVGAPRGESGTEDTIVYPSNRNCGGTKLYDIVGH